MGRPIYTDDEGDLERDIYPEIMRRPQGYYWSAAEDEFDGQEVTHAQVYRRAWELQRAGELDDGTRLPQPESAPREPRPSPRSNGFRGVLGSGGDASHQLIRVLGLVTAPAVTP